MRLPSTRLLRDYATFLREEPRARAYVAGSIIDDIGIAVSAWAASLMMTDLAATQRERASMMLPTLCCFLIGALVSGPLADWASRSLPAQLARWRYKVVLAGRALETVFLAVLVFQLAAGPATIPRILPYLMVSALMKTGLRATRIAFSLDLLHHESVQHALDGTVLRDENGDALKYKTHLVSFTSLSAFFAATATLGGLLLGNRILGAVGGRSWILFGVDVFTNLAFVAVIARWCHPDKKPRDVGLRDLVGREPLTAVADRPPRIGALRHFLVSFVEGFRFLARPAQRPLRALLIGSLVVEVVAETYDGRMILRHVLHADAEGVRYAQIAWKLIAALGAAALPLVVRRVGLIGKIFLVTMLLDGLVIALAGRVAGAGAVSAVAPFVGVLALDHTLTLASGTLTDVAQNSISSAAMRGRIAGSYALIVIVGDMLAEGAATGAAEAWGIPGMLMRVGLLQVGAVALIGLWGGRTLWRFGVGTGDDEAAVQGASSGNLRDTS